MADSEKKSGGATGFLYLFIIVGLVTFAGLFAKNKYDEYELNKYRPKNDEGIEHCVINAPFDEEIYKYSFFPKYRQFKDQYYGKFEVIEKQMSVPLNITFYDKDWKIVSEHPIVDLQPEEIADLIRSKGFYEHEDKDAYREHAKKLQPGELDMSKEAFRKALEEGTDEEKKAYETALDALGMTKEEFFDPEGYKLKKEKEEAEKKAKEEAEKKKAGEPKEISSGKTEEGIESQDL